MAAGSALTSAIQTCRELSSFLLVRLVAFLPDDELDPLKVSTLSLLHAILRAVTNAEEELEEVSGTEISLLDQVHLKAKMKEAGVAVLPPDAEACFMSFGLTL